MRLPIFATLVMLALPAAALADPVGNYDLTGKNPDSNETYKGTVKVTRTGETYSVVWRIAGETISGLGIGVRLVDGQALPGPASQNDVGLSVSYESDGEHGTVIYFQQPDGTWHGVWAYNGWKQISTEDWVPRDRKPVAKAENVMRERAKSVDKMQTTSAPEPQQVGPKN